MDDKERAALAETLGRLSPEKLDEVERQARKTLADLEDANSAYPETKKFLAERGLTNVRELDKEGMRELREHLERTLQSLCKAKA